MSNDKKTLNENTVRRFMTLANLKPLSNMIVREQLDDEELDDMPDLGGEPELEEPGIGGDELDLGGEAEGGNWDVEQVRDLTVAITDAIEGVTGVETSVSGGEEGGDELDDLGGEGDMDLGGEEDEDLGEPLEEQTPVSTYDFSDEPLEIKSTPATRAKSGTSLPGDAGMKGTGTEKDPISPIEPTEFTVKKPTTAKEAIQREAMRRYQIHGTRLQETHRRQLDQQTANNLYAQCYNQVLSEFRTHQARQNLITEVHKSVIAQLKVLSENNRRFTAADVETLIRKTLSEITKRSQKDSLVEAVMQRVASRLSKR
tara:strand:+ start:846 stop:1787 length:942 start_codon:yes stop_codon:yes gene_type:complete